MKIRLRNGRQVQIETAGDRWRRLRDELRNCTHPMGVVEYTSGALVCFVCGPVLGSSDG